VILTLYWLFSQGEKGEACSVPYFSMVDILCVLKQKFEIRPEPMILASLGVGQCIPPQKLGLGKVGLDNSASLDFAAEK
tara:strand:+ start:3372 stop:3608 length:237 start_codon:yes stop_codon:yes gene_type:complete